MQTVLAVASEPLVLRVLCTLLKYGGYFVLSGQSAAAALDITVRHPGPIDLLVTEVFMPEVNGRELARELHRRRPEVRCLFLSGSPYKLVSEIIGRSAPFLAKPFTFRALKRAVGDALRADLPFVRGLTGRWGNGKF